MAKTKFEVYKDKMGTYRWRLLAQNGEAVANGGEAYASKNGASNAAKKLKDWSKTKDIVDVEKEKEIAKKQAEKEKAQIAKDKEKAKALKDKAKTGKKVVKTTKKPLKKVLTKAKPLAKAKPLSKTKSKSKKSKPALDDVEMHIVKKEDKYDGVTVIQAMENGLDRELM